MPCLKSALQAALEAVVRFRAPWHTCHTMPKRSSASRALAILAVDDIHVSARGRELLRQCESGAMTYDKARADVSARAHTLALLREAFETRAEADAWWDRPHPMLDGLTPHAAYDSGPEGVERVRGILAAIRYGGAV